MRWLRANQRHGVACASAHERTRARGAHTRGRVWRITSRRAAQRRRPTRGARGSQGSVTPHAEELRTAGLARGGAAAAPLARARTLWHARLLRCLFPFTMAPAPAPARGAAGGRQRRHSGGVGCCAALFCPLEAKRLSRAVARGPARAPRRMCLLPPPRGGSWLQGSARDRRLCVCRGCHDVLMNNAQMKKKRGLANCLAHNHVL